MSWRMYSVKQSDRNSSKMDNFHKPTTYKPHVETSSKQKITFARHEYGQVRVFRIRIRSLVQLFPSDCITQYGFKKVWLSYLVT